MSSQALIDKILKTAENEADQITNEILRRAGENEKMIIDRAKAESEEISKLSAERCEQIKRIAKLTSGLQARKARLHARRELLDEAFGQAYSKMLAMPDDKRRDYIMKLISRYAPADKITAYVAKRDMPLFEKEIEFLGPDGKGVLVAFSENAEMKGGVYMSSEQADVDCSLDAIFEELHEKYEAEADRMMFSGNGAADV